LESETPLNRKNGMQGVRLVGASPSSGEEENGVKTEGGEEEFFMMEVGYC